MKRIIKTLIPMIYTIFVITYVVILGLNFNDDYRVIREYDERKYNILVITFLVFIFYILFSYFYKKYLSRIIVHIFIYIFYYNLIIGILTNWVNNETTIYYYYYYIFLTFIHSIILFLFLYNYFCYKDKGRNYKGRLVYLNLDANKLNKKIIELDFGYLSLEVFILDKSYNLKINKNYEFGKSIESIYFKYKDDLPKFVDKYSDKILNGDYDK